MNAVERFTRHFMFVASLLILAPVASAASPTEMAVNVEVWNGTGEDLSLSGASWLAPGTDLSPYVIPGDSENASFFVTQGNPKKDSAAFRLRSDEKVCEFKLGHEARFQWMPVNPAPEKTASAKSVGSVQVKCGASVIKGTDSLSAYTVRVVMQDITQ
ncbi:hypothetical protein [Pseudomonas huanghezhanensis]|uniref:hypothetical protein n=1 Tax=Pseudomonas huanghezhanensis TaxID=3002903 RepID=UPI002285D1A6|nr:hypothetical protein [Pseudomonas sp. BSw22131]